MNSVDTTPRPTKARSLILTKTVGGAVVYTYKEEPAHYVCPSCAAQQQIQILQDLRSMSGKFRCPGCKNEYPINPINEPPQSDSGWRPFT